MHQVQNGKKENPVVSYTYPQEKQGEESTRPCNVILSNRIKQNSPVMPGCFYAYSQPGYFNFYLQLLQFFPFSHIYPEKSMDYFAISG